MIYVRCEKCGEMLEAPGSMAGQTIDCPKCQAANYVGERRSKAQRAFVALSIVFGVIAPMIIAIIYEAGVGQGKGYLFVIMLFLAYIVGFLWERGNKI